ncbi:hypothetical protein RPB_4683 [Rhodopseudomonas palustris HaA2]|uniref:Uncharacterized protein n=1 Tax=Rhodopseudomonas palustris (strain HaA2) TaxID=316058 RepID=Q2IQZ4_RHOP2|nr:hypothetical protein [Rhodopseudomonas palustris]ABD09366.1 hypothetical protein RPB_4683 [Rhodopseudomonas palustris HaA2]
MMGGWRKKKKDGDGGKDKAGDASDKAAPVRLPVDDVYDTGDIAAPERDRDDEQRDL